MKKLLFVVLILIIFFLLFFSIDRSPFSTIKPVQENQVSLDREIIAENLSVPWSMVFLPNEDILITEREGRLRLIDETGSMQKEPVFIFQNIFAEGEGGLLGMTLDPNFSENNNIYFYYTYQESGGDTLNRVVKMKYQENKLSDEQIIVDRIPGALNHNGGRIKFGPDGFLYISTGDAQNPSQAQNTNSLAGKILRVTVDGRPAVDNPFNNSVYSYGHRNSQGLAWDRSGNLWATEHGRSGIQSGLDELNLIERGKNYGWPEIEGNQTKSGMETPKLNSGATNTWAPSGAVIFEDSLFFTGLRGEALYEVKINENDLSIKEHLKGEYGRIRNVELGPDNNLYISTSNKDGRGNPRSGDDQIIKINPKNL